LISSPYDLFDPLIYTSKFLLTKTDMGGTIPMISFFGTFMASDHLFYCVYVCCGVLAGAYKPYGEGVCHEKVRRLFYGADGGGDIGGLFWRRA
jgi:hypothetical protein